MSLFDLGTPRKSPSTRGAPLAELLRPERLEDVVGLEDLLGEGKFLRNAIASDRFPSLVFWGPPGSGKTTLARIIAKTTRARFVPFSATSSGIREIRQLMEEARKARELRGEKTIVFIDEIHRFNKAQQDAFLSYVEAGDIILIGATTENPSFEINSALLSRSKVVVIPRLEHDQILTILARALEHERVRSTQIELEPAAVDFIASVAGGDARQALNSLQLIVETARPEDGLVTLPRAKEILHQRSLVYDKSGEEHYNVISALHKSIRNGDADASLYWLARMLEGGEDPLYLARRLVRAAAEDVGLADPGALQLAVAAKDATHFIGMPEAGVVLAELAVYLAQAPKSNAVYRAWGEAVREVREGEVPPVPLHIRNAPTALMKDLGYGSGYQYAHDFDEQTAPMDCLPEALAGRRFYDPGEVGFEASVRERLERLRQARRRMKGEPE
ncbi:MAG TPA: replication-associated recombination protein A [Thermoanaerobaculia bacterium]|nr:replication-associated recombination protein A [Thermoanaerobaculia bacterium]